MYQCGKPGDGAPAETPPGHKARQGPAAPEIRAARGEPGDQERRPRPRPRGRRRAEPAPGVQGTGSRPRPRSPGRDTSRPGARQGPAAREIRAARGEPGDGAPAETPPKLKATPAESHARACQPVPTQPPRMVRGTGVGARRQTDRTPGPELNQRARRGRRFTCALGVGGQGVETHGEKKSKNGHG